MAKTTPGAKFQKIYACRALRPQQYCDHQENLKPIIGRDHLKCTQRGITAWQRAEDSKWTVYQPAGRRRKTRTQGETGLMWRYCPLSQSSHSKKDPPKEDKVFETFRNFRSGPPPQVFFFGVSFPETAEVTKAGCRLAFRLRKACSRSDPISALLPAPWPPAAGGIGACQPTLHR